MAELVVNKKSIYNLFTTQNISFLIPDYQRAYAWDEDKCKTLWDDLIEFCIPNNNYQEFNEDDLYFLGSIVTCPNNNNHEIIDGQQRITTLFLLLRAFYESFKDNNAPETEDITREIKQCIFKKIALAKINENEIKIDSEVATDEEKEEFISILKTGEVDKSYKSKYAENYKFFKKEIENYSISHSTNIFYLADRILHNCIILPIEAESQNTALRIFSTLNDRGMPLSDSDIFKSQFYHYYKQKDKKDEFIDNWTYLEYVCSELFDNEKGNSMDEIFTRYMYYERAKLTSYSTTEALRKFYEKDKYKLLHTEETLDNLIDLVEFWEKIQKQDSKFFTIDVLKKLFILNYAPNSMWTFFISVYYFAKRNENNTLDMNDFSDFLSKTIGFIFAYQITNPGVNSLRTPIYAEMKNLVENKLVTFSNFLFSANDLREKLKYYDFFNSRAITKSMLVWWAYYNSDQELLSIKDKFDIEHIYAKKRNEKQPLSEEWVVESIGNKTILENKINVRSADYRFEDKKNIYKGYKDKPATKIKELLNLTQKNDFLDKDIRNREEKILDGFINYLRENSLLKDSSK